MNILIVISEAPPVRSGVSRVAEHLSEGLRARGHHVDTLSVNEIPRKTWGEVRLSSMPLRLPQLKRQILEYDLIHLHGPVPTFSDTFLLWWSKLPRDRRPPLVYTYHAPIDLHTYPLKLLSTPYNMLQGRLACLADHVVVSSPAYRQHLVCNVNPAKISSIPWGVDADRFATSVEKDGPFTALFLGQMRPYKGLPVLLEACTGLPDMQLWVVGDGHGAAESRQRAAELGCTNVTFWGALSDDEVVEKLQQSHVIVLPSISRSEAFGIVLLEGMAAGCVPIASHLPGVENVVGNEGFTFTPGDVAALQAALTRLKDDRALLVHMAGIAQAKARLFSWERVIFEYEDVFTQVLKRHRPHLFAPAQPTEPALLERAVGM